MSYDGAASKCLYVLNLFLLTVQKDIKVRARMALLHTAVTINLVIDDFVDSVVVLGSSQGVVFFLLDCTIYFTKARWQCKLI